MVMRAELDGLICSGAMKGKQHTYALLDERVPSTRRIDREEALAELIKRYFTSRGPATVKDIRHVVRLHHSRCHDTGLESVGLPLRSDTFL